MSMKRTPGKWASCSCQILACGLFCSSLSGLRAADNWLWAKSIGGMWGTRVGVDGSGNSYVLGQFYGQETNGGVTLQPQTNTANGFLVKYDPSGNLRWTRQVGAEGRAMHVDSGGIYLAGYIAGKARIGSVDFQSQMNRQVMFVARYDSTGDVLWARKVGEADRAFVNCVSVDSGGNYYVAGNFHGGGSFGGSSGPIDFTVSTSGSDDMFIAKYSPNGAKLWVQTLGGIAHDSVDDIVVSDSGECFIMGHLGELSDNVRIGSTNIERQLLATKFLGKLNPQGEFEWVKEINVGRSGYIFPYDSLAIDQAANVYVVGVFQNSAKIASASLRSTNASDFYVAKFDRTGGLAWARSGGVCCENDVRGVAVDKNGDLYVTGLFSYQAFLSGNQPSQRVPVLRKYSQTGELLGEEYGSTPVGCNGIAIDPAGNLVIAGTLGLGGGSLGQAQLSADAKTGLAGFIAKLRPFIRAGIARVQLISQKEVRISVQGFAESNYRIETSTNLLQWASFLTWPGANGVFEFSDFPTPNTPAKFYRVITLP